MIHRLLVAILVVQTFAAVAQQPASPAREGSNWKFVQDLPVGSSLYVKVKKHTTTCMLKGVDADSLTCVRGSALTGKDLVFQRSDIGKIQTAHRVRSALVTAAPGGVLLGVGLIGASTHRNDGILGGFGWDIAAAGGGVAAIIGAPIGYFKDFTRDTVYTAP